MSEAAELRRQRAARRRRRQAIGSVVAVVVLGGAAFIADTVIESGPSGYRTAATTTGSAAHTVDVTGTVQPVDQAAADFQVGGTVSSLKVAMGQHVTAGAVLATLSPTSLQQAVTAAQSSLTSAEAQLSENEAGQATSGRGAGSPSGGSRSNPSSTTALAEPGTIVLTSDVLTASGPSGGASLKAAQQAVVNAQKAADAAAHAAAADLANAESVCAGVTTPTTTTTAPTRTTTTPSTSTTTTTAPSSGLVTGSPQSCEAALAQALSDQNQLSQDQNGVAGAEGQLARILGEMASSSSHTSPGSSTSGSKPSTSKGSSTPSNGSTGTGASSSNNGSSSSSSAAADSAQQLASDQATIDADQASLVSAQVSLAQAQLVSPISGTVASVNISKGQVVGAGSTSDTITIIGSGSYEATADLSVDQVPQVVTGEPVYVSVNGTTGSLTGTVTRVGPVDLSSTDVFPLVVTITSDPGGLSDGAAADIQVVTSQIQQAKVVPTSAVHTSSVGRSYVLTLKAGKTVETPVTVGVVGSTYTQITSGLPLGTEVVLADLSEPLPTSNENSNQTLRSLNGAGGFPGIVFRGGGGGAIQFKG